MGGNFDFDPEFSYEGDYHYKLSEGSNCINKGIIENGLNLYLPDYDIDGNSRLDTVTNVIDLGAYEFSSPEATDTESIITDNDLLDIVKQGSFLIIVSDKSYSGQIFDIKGTELHAFNITKGNNQISLPNLSKGIYLIRFTSNKQFHIKKLLIN